MVCLREVCRSSSMRACAVATVTDIQPNVDRLCVICVDNSVNAQAKPHYR